MESTPRTNPHPDVGRSNEIFNALQASDSFWVGTSTRICKGWILPEPTIVFMVLDTYTDLSGPFGISLPHDSDYIIFTCNLFTCIYRNMSRPSPTTDENPMEKPELTQNSSTLVVPLEPSLKPDPTTSSGNEIKPTNEPEHIEVNEVEIDDGSTCFPSGAIVEMEDGTLNKMSLLRIGDRVHVGKRKFSDVFMFTHKVSDAHFDFIKISCVTTEIVLTRGHYLYVNGALSPAKTVRAGDLVELGSGESSMVTSVSYVKRAGLYNPQTISGDIVVNDVRASTYTTTVEPIFAHVLLTPFRATYNGFGVATSIFEHEIASHVQICFKWLGVVVRK